MKNKRNNAVRRLDRLEHIRWRGEPKAQGAWNRFGSQFHDPRYSGQLRDYSIRSGRGGGHGTSFNARPGSRNWLPKRLQASALRGCQIISDAPNFQRPSVCCGWMWSLCGMFYGRSFSKVGSI